MPVATKQEQLEGWMEWAGPEAKAGGSRLFIEWSRAVEDRGLPMNEPVCPVCHGFVDEHADSTVAFCNADGDVDMYHDACIHE